MGTKARVGIIGCGNICGAYFTGCAAFPILDVVACADLDMDRAESVAEEHGVKACTVDALLKDPDIQIVVNLTVPIRLSSSMIRSMTVSTGDVPRIPATSAKVLPVK